MKKLATLVTLAFLASATPVLAKDYSSLQFTQASQRDTSLFKVSVNIPELERIVKSSPSKKSKFDLQYATLVSEFRFDLASDLLQENYGDAREMTYDLEIFKTYSADLEKRRKTADRFYGRLLDDKKLFVKEFESREKRLKRLSDEERLRKLRNFLIGAKQYLSQDYVDREAVFVDQLLGEIEAESIDVACEDFDLEKSFKKKRFFEKNFFELTDELHDFATAKKYLDALNDYASTLQTSKNFFKYERILLAKKERFKEKSTDTIAGVVTSHLELPSDTINPNGIYRVDDNMLVVVTSVVNHSGVNVINGALLLEAKKKLLKYTKEMLPDERVKNKVAFFEQPYYFVKDKPYAFLKVDEKDSYQARFIFSLVSDPKITEEIRDGYLSPVTIDRGKVFDGTIDGVKVNYFDNPYARSLILFRPRETVIIRDRNKDGIIDLVDIIRDDERLLKRVNNGSDMFKSIQEEYNKKYELIKDSIQ